MQMTCFISQINLHSAYWKQLINKTSKATEEPVENLYA
jgi:hypothetical protein